MARNDCFLLKLGILFSRSESLNPLAFNAFILCSLTWLLLKIVSKHYLIQIKTFIIKIFTQTTLLSEFFDRWLSWTKLNRIYCCLTKSLLIWSWSLIKQPHKTKQQWRLLKAWWQAQEFHNCNYSLHWSDPTLNQKLLCFPFFKINSCDNFSFVYKTNYFFFNFYSSHYYNIKTNYY